MPAFGQTRHALSASFVHSLIYCFQGQGEIANPDILFHRQNREWMPQTIRDTLPYFLGAQGADDLRRREELVERRRELRRLNQRLTRRRGRAFRRPRSGGRAARRDASTSDCSPIVPKSSRPGEARVAILRRALDNPIAMAAGS